MKMKEKKAQTILKNVLKEAKAPLQSVFNEYDLSDEEIIFLKNNINEFFSLMMQAKEILNAKPIK